MSLIEIFQDLALKLKDMWSEMHMTIDIALDSHKDAKAPQAHKLKQIDMAECMACHKKFAKRYWGDIECENCINKKRCPICHRFLVNRFCMCQK